ncbi:MAG: 16S rRNA (guanine(527)-N(7))-methyltransferase RsmG [Calditrichaeota bacterium]|nr:16S rRNA (guanine(527)-N(7))-methyltransferase RsmG [Calditrichota bacterium]RQV98176.1 MAG: 16S rRNA (guanine(527)-N(7))-methyltransferase RsmG [Calditrichota bacterium]
MKRLTGHDSAHLLYSIFPDISAGQVQQIQQFVDLLRSYNLKINLISRADIANVWENHILPSLLVEKIVQLPAKAEVMDLGSGGGLPGIPLKILRPDMHIILLDSSRRKTAFLRTTVDKLNLKNISVVTARLPDDQGAVGLLERFDVVLSRAVSDFETLCDLSEPLLRNRGFLLAWKGESDLDQLETIREKGKLRIEVHSVPEKYLSLSAKFRTLRFVKIVFGSAEEGKP